MYIYVCLLLLLLLLIILFYYYYLLSFYYYIYIEAAKHSLLLTTVHTYIYNLIVRISYVIFTKIRKFSIRWNPVLSKQTHKKHKPLSPSNILARYCLSLKIQKTRVIRLSDCSKKEMPASFQRFGQSLRPRGNKTAGLSS